MRRLVIYPEDVQGLMAVSPGHARKVIRKIKKAEREILSVLDFLG